METTSASRMKLEPTERGAKLRGAILAKFGSFPKCAAFVGCGVDTVRRAVYSDKPIDFRGSTLKAFKKAKIARRLLPVAV